MERNLKLLQETEFDVLVIGGGIYGVCTAWDAALRGLSVALIEKDDFGSATSSNSLKIVHGGLRYLQHADIKRMRESTAERRTLMRIAPHFVHPMPCLMPTYGHALKGKEVMALALFLNDLISFDRNGLTDPQKNIPRGRILSRRECKELIPGIDEAGLSGGALWYDCQLSNSERMLISIVHSAVAAGAVAANYVEMLQFSQTGNRIHGVVARDNLSGEPLEIRARVVVNNSGPWVNEILGVMNGSLRKPKIKPSAAMNIVLNRKIFPEHAVGLWSKEDFKDKDAVVSKGSRLLFVTPWRDRSIIGTTHVPYEGRPDSFRIRERDVASFVEEINQAYPPANIKREDVSFFYGGLLPADDVNESSAHVRLLKTYRIVDHRDDGIEGLVSVIGVKYTTARDVAERTVDYLARKLDRKVARSRTAETPIFGGEIENFESYLFQEKAKGPFGLKESIIHRLILNYGSQYETVLDRLHTEPELAQPLDGSGEILKAEVVYAVKEEMAQKLADVVRRRTELGSVGLPSDQALERCAVMMAEELGWSEARIQQEIEETKSIYVPAP